MFVARLKLSQCIQSALKLVKLKHGLPLTLPTQKMSQLQYELQCGSENTDMMLFNAFHLSALAQNISDNTAIIWQYDAQYIVCTVTVDNNLIQERIKVLQTLCSASQIRTAWHAGMQQTPAVHDSLSKHFPNHLQFWWWKDLLSKTQGWSKVNAYECTDSDLC